MSKWKRVSLGELYSFRSGLSKPRSAFGSGYGFLSFKDVFYNYFVPERLTELVNSTEHERESCSVHRGDVFFTRTSETIDELGMSCAALKDHPDVTFNGFTKRLRPMEGVEIIPEYAGYYFRSPSFRREITAMASLSTRASLNNEMLERLTMLIPSVDEQEKIGRILKSLDDKIEINRRMNRTLEAIARTIFKSWFIDFDPVIDNALASGKPIPEELRKRAEIRRQILARNNGGVGTVAYHHLFPDEFEDSPLGKIPEGWVMLPIGDVVQVLGGGTPSTKKPSYWEGGSHPFCTPKDMSSLMNPVLLETGRHITDEGLAKVSSGQLPVGTVLLSSRAPIGYLAITETLVSVNQGIIAMVCHGELTAHYVYHWCQANMAKIKGNAGGTTFAEISKRNYRPIPILVPPREFLDAFEEQVMPLFERIKVNARSNNTLAETRDTLLPKLLNGKLGGSNSEKASKEGKV